SLQQKTTAAPSKRRSQLKKYAIAYSFILPNLIGFAIFTLIPMAFSLVLALMNWDGANRIRRAGLDNFKQLLGDETFRISLVNTIIVVSGIRPLTMLAALGLAILLSQPLRRRNVSRVTFFLPYFASLLA